MKGTVVLEPGLTININVAGSRPLKRKIKAITITPTGVHLELIEVDGSKSERRWAKEKPMKRLFDKE